MKRLIRKTLDISYRLIDRSHLTLLRPLVNAADSMFFRGVEVTEGAPHIRDGVNLKRMFIFVVFAAMPSALAGIYLFGMRVILFILISYVVGIGVEVVFAALRKEEISEGAFVTCILYPLTLPPDLPLWMVALGIFVGTMFGKEVFGGTGFNIFNPALVGRMFLYICFPAAMTSNWLEPLGDAITTATPLALFKSSGDLVSYGNLFWGNVSGSVGETSAFLIIIGGLFLIITRVADWRIPVSYLGSAALFAFIFHGMNPTLFSPVLFQLLSGGLLFGAFFMATDPVSSPFTKEGRWLFGFLCGFLTILIRGVSGYIEGVMFAILFMNIFSSIIDHMALSMRYREMRR